MELESSEVSIQKNENMKTIIANFGVRNYLWPQCKANNFVATFEDDDVYPFWERNDKEGYIARSMRFKKTAAGIPPTRAVASRWFNVTSLIHETVDDLWLHLDQDGLWWTYSRSGNITVTPEKGHNPEQPVVVIRRPADAWSNFDRNGNRLATGALHPRAIALLAIQSTIQQPSQENAKYLQAIIDGSDLSPWHGSEKWKNSESVKGPRASRVTDTLQVTLERMADTALATVTNSQGQERVVPSKIKNFGFDSRENFIRYLRALYVSQEGLCALSGLPMILDYEGDDDQMRYSLDRIDSNGHYAPGNLQLVCRFINRWKGADQNSEFMRLMHCLKSDMARRLTADLGDSALCREILSWLNPQEVNS